MDRLNSNYEGNNSNRNGDNTANYNSMICYYHWYTNHGLEWYTFMMTSSNGNIFHVTGHLYGEFTGLRWIPAQKPVARSFGVFFDLRLNKRSSKQLWGWWLQTLSCPLWRHCNVSTLRVIYAYFIGVDKIMYSVDAVWKTGGIIRVLNYATKESPFPLTFKNSSFIIYHQLLAMSTKIKYQESYILYFVRCVLQIKGTTINVITLGECGRVPPSVSCRASTICFMNRVSSMPDTTLVKQVLNSLMNLHDQGFKTWVSPVLKVMRKLDIDPSSDKSAFNKKCKQTLIENFKTDWGKNLRDIQRNPILITYNTFKQRYVTEPYLYLVKNIKYRVALSRFRSSSHTLEIERWRYAKPIIPVQERLCRVCLFLEDERHLLFHCILYDGERRQLLSKIEAKYNGFLSLDIHQMWSFLLSNEDCQCLTWLGKYLYDAFEIRNRYIASISDGNVLWADVNIHRSRFATCLASWKKSLRILIILHVRTLPIKLHICMCSYIFVYVPATPLHDNPFMPVPLWEEVECLQIV